MYFSPIILLILALSDAKAPVFEAQTLEAEVAIGYGLGIGDVDGDGKADILLADKKQFVWYRSGDWKKFVIAENLTASDNVCLAARDLDGDGKVEVAVGAQWNPGETSDTTKSGAVFFLIRPNDPTQLWTPKQLHHEPTTHRMRWVKNGDSAYLIVVPLHGRGNANGAGEGVKVIAYELPTNPAENWKQTVIEESMHLTHNLDVVGEKSSNSILLGGKEGIRLIHPIHSEWNSAPIELPSSPSVGELRLGSGMNRVPFLATVEPMHGTSLVVYEGFEKNLNSKNVRRTVLNSQLKEGHALAVGDFLGLGRDQIAIGWRVANEAGEFGIKLFVPKNSSFSEFEEHWIDKNGMACEDLQAADLDGDGRLDLIASGRSTRNLKIYWNRN